MFRAGKGSRILIATLCVAIITLRVAGLHAHLCMDGTEPPLSLHVADSGIHHLDEASGGEPHVDRDMSIATDVVVKKLSGNLDLCLLAAFCALLFFALSRPRPRQGRVLSSSPAVFRSNWNRLRPPLRGPPSLA
jgi:hypothetical protein